MVALNAVEIIEYRAELAADQNALRALDMIEDCEGDLEDAAIALALRSGQEPGESDGWLASLAKRWRTIICQTEFREALEGGSVAQAIKTLEGGSTMPPGLATPVALPLEEKL
jgi:hypothetical protein